MYPPWGLELVLDTGCFSVDPAQGKAWIRGAGIFLCFISENI